MDEHIIIPSRTVSSFVIASSSTLVLMALIRYHDVLPEIGEQ